MIDFKLCEVCEESCCQECKKIKRLCTEGIELCEKARIVGRDEQRLYFLGALGKLYAALDVYERISQPPTERS